MQGETLNFLIELLFLRRKKKRWQHAHTQTSRVSAWQQLINLAVLRYKQLEHSKCIRIIVFNIESTRTQFMVFLTHWSCQFFFLKILFCFQIYSWQGHQVIIYFSSWNQKSNSIRKNDLAIHFLNGASTLKRINYTSSVRKKQKKMQEISKRFFALNEKKRTMCLHRSRTGDSVIPFF